MLGKKWWRTFDPSTGSIVFVRRIAEISLTATWTAVTADV